MTKLGCLRGAFTPLCEMTHVFRLSFVNHPLLPIPDEIPYPFVGDGGQSGLDITLHILKGGDTHLEENTKYC